MHIFFRVHDQRTSKSLICIDLEAKFFNRSVGSGFTTRSPRLREATILIEAEFEYVPESTITAVNL